MYINVIGDMRLQMFSEQKEDLYYKEHKINFCNYFCDDEEYYYQIKIISKLTSVHLVKIYYLCLSVSCRVFKNIIEHKFMKEFNSFDEINEYLNKNIMTKNQLRKYKLKKLEEI